MSTYVIDVVISRARKAIHPTPWTFICARELIDNNVGLRADGQVCKLLALMNMQIGPLLNTDIPERQIAVDFDRSFAQK